MGFEPLDEMLDPIWSSLRDIAGERLSDADWDAFRHFIEGGGGGHDGFLYRHKTTQWKGDLGPFGFLVREALYYPDAIGNHDYLGCPEIVQDIARRLRSTHDIDIEALFLSASVPCVVKFRVRGVRPRAVEAALWYLYSKVRQENLSWNSNWTFSGEGAAVSSGDVLAVDLA